MKTDVKKLVLGASLVGVMSMVSGCASMGMCGGSKCGASGKCGSDKKAPSSKCGGDKSATTKCGSK